MNTLTDEEKRARLRKRAEGVFAQYANKELIHGELDSLLLAVEALAFLNNKEDYYSVEDE